MQSAGASKLRAGILAACCALLVPDSHAIDIQFDFTYDTNNFFTGNLLGQNTLNAAAQVFEARLSDNLTAITPSGGNQWTATFSHPGTGQTRNVQNLSIANSVIKVYVGGRDLPGSTLGQGGPGGFQVSGNPAFIQTVALRGQLAADDVPSRDFGPWGGAITFDTLTPWYFDQDVTTIEPIPLLDDFYSVALHELAHLLGFGTADSWFDWIDGSTFEGPASLTLRGGTAVPLDSSAQHWANGTRSEVAMPVVIQDQETAMDPTLFTGTRKYFTELDFAALDDIGWQVIPEPGTAILLWTSATLVAIRRRRGNRASS